MTRRHFSRGRSVFKCSICGRSTRLVGQPEYSELCTECDELAMMENSVADGCQTIAEIAKMRDEYIADAVRKGGSAEALRVSFDSLFE